MSDQLVDSGADRMARVQPRVHVRSGVGVPVKTDEHDLSPKSFLLDSTPGQQLLTRLRMAEGRADLVSEQLIEATHRTAELKVALDSMRNTLKRCRESRDQWKAKAMKYQADKGRLYGRIYYYRAQRDFWRHRALAKDES